MTTDQRTSRPYRALVAALLAVLLPAVVAMHSVAGHTGGHGSPAHAGHAPAAADAAWPPGAHGVTPSAIEPGPLHGNDSTYATLLSAPAVAATVCRSESPSAPSVHTGTHDCLAIPEPDIAVPVSADAPVSSVELRGECLRCDLLGVRAGGRAPPWTTLSSEQLSVWRV